MITLILITALAAYAFVRSWQSWRDGKPMFFSIAFMLIAAFETLMAIKIIKELL